MAEAPDVELTATQFVILSENQRKKRALADSKHAYNSLLGEHRALLARLEETTAEAYSVSESFRQEVLAKNQQIAELQDQLEQLRAAKEEELGQLMEQGAAREAQLQEGAYAQLEALAYERDSLQAELDSVLEFKQHKAECDAALAAVREEAVGLREALEAQRGQLERHYTGQHARMRKEYEQRLEELKRCQEEELEERLDAGVKRILGANRRLAEELRLHVEEHDALQGELKLLAAERSRLARELALKADMEDAWAARAGQQAAALKEAHGRVAALEASLQQVLADFAKERASVVAAAQAQVTGAAGDVDALRRLLRLKGRELVQLRRLGQEVLLQRSEVEVFLLSSLHQVRLEIERERMQQPASPATAAASDPAAAAATASSQPPPLQQPAGTSGSGQEEQQQAERTPALPGGSISIRDLCWQERERVLRLLFAKLSGRAREPPNLPPHELAAQLPASAAAVPSTGQQLAAAVVVGR